MTHGKSFNPWTPEYRAVVVAGPRELADMVEADEATIPDVTLMRNHSPRGGGSIERLAVKIVTRDNASYMPALLAMGMLPHPFDVTEVSPRAFS